MSNHFWRSVEVMCGANCQNQDFQDCGSQQGTVSFR